MEYIVAGDFEVCGKIKTCLITSCHSEKTARELVEKYKANPPDDCLGNVRLVIEESDKCWWNNGTCD